MYLFFVLFRGLCWQLLSDLAVVKSQFTSEDLFTLHQVHVLGYTSIFRNHTKAYIAVWLWGSHRGYLACPFSEEIRLGEHKVIAYVWCSDHVICMWAGHVILLKGTCHTLASWCDSHTTWYHIKLNRGVDVDRRGCWDNGNMTFWLLDQLCAHVF